MLASRYRADLRVYAEAAQFLIEAVGTGFSEALMRAQRTRLAFERSRGELERHVQKHNCLQTKR
jgi:hypothetical protein